MFVDFLCTDVSSLFPHLVMFMPTKEIVSCSAISIGKFKFSWQEFSLSRKSLALLRSGMIVKVEFLEFLTVFNRDGFNFCLIAMFYS